MSDQDGGVDFIEIGRKLFAGPCDFIWAVVEEDKLPLLGPPEIAFAGRSNVGKSSLVNALTGRKTLARTSNTPGRTQHLNFFALGAESPNEKLRLVDMPGYGYAAVGKQKVSAWTKLMQAYLRGRSSLARVFVLVDGRRGLRDTDIEMMDLLDSSAVSYQVVLTKRDEVKKSEQQTRLDEVATALSRRPAAFPQILFTSAQTGEDIPELRAAVARLMAERVQGSTTG
jgi:GTP-binding protein